MLACLLAVVPAQSPELQARVDAATATARASIALRPTDASAHRELSGIYEKHKFIRAASSAFAAAIALEPRDGEGYQKLAYLRKRSGDPEGALAALKTAEALLPTSGQVLVDLAGLESGPEHEQTLRRAVRVAPDLTSAYHMLARTLVQGGAGRAAEVEYTYQSLMRFDPTSAARRLYDFQYYDNRRVEAAVSFKRAKVAIEAMGLPRSTESCKRHDTTRHDTTRHDAVFSPAASDPRAWAVRTIKQFMGTGDKGKLVLTEKEVKTFFRA